MLDENLPTYRFKQSSENPLNSILYFTHNGSEPTPEYLLKRPLPSTSANQFALGLFDSFSTNIVYSEVLVKPDWVQPSLTAAESRAGNGPAPQSPVVPETFAISLYNPDQSVAVKLVQGSWGKSDSWEFEIPERTFKMPSASLIDQDSNGASELVPKLCFKWKRDSRLSKDMTCYMTGKSVAGKKNKDPDITIAFFRAKNDSVLTIYEPNLARVDIEDRKGLELSLLMSGEVVRDLYLNPRQNPFNISGGASAAAGRRRNTSPKATSPVGGPTMSGALNNTRPASPPPSTKPTQPAQPSADKARQQAEIEAETERLKAMVAEEERQARERREEEEQRRVQKLIESEDNERRKREEEVDKETERLRREYGMQGQDFGGQTSPVSPVSPVGPGPTMPPRPNQRPMSVGPGFYGPPYGQQPFFPGPPQPQAQPPAQAGPSGSGNNEGKKKHGLGGLFQSAAPYAGPAMAKASGFFGGSSNAKAEEEKRKKVAKKRSVHF